METNIEDVKVSDDYLLLVAIKEENDLPTKKIAAMTSMAAPTIYAYLSGRSTIPVSVWRAVYELTGDARIVRLITGEKPYVIVSLEGGTAEPTDEGEIESLIEMRKKQIEFESLMLDAMRGQRAAGLEKAFMDMVSCQGRVYQMFNGS